MWRAFGARWTASRWCPARFEHSGDRVLAHVTFRGSGERGDFEFSGAQVFTIARRPDRRRARVPQRARGEGAALLTLAFTASGEVAQLVEHTTENRGVASSILALAIA